MRHPEEQASRARLPARVPEVDGTHQLPELRQVLLSTVHGCK